MMIVPTLVPYIKSTISPYKKLNQTTMTKIKLSNVQVRLTITFPMNHSAMNSLVLHVLKKGDKVICKMAKLLR